MVLGTTIRGIAVLPIVTTTTRTSRNNNIGFRVVVSAASALLCQSRRMGIRRACLKESRPVPVMSMTISENQTGLGSLVGVIAEQLLNSTKLLVFWRFFKT
ncbi:hypothetical protein IQ277_16690 [Nostocales cyanobacterium LEGE 12452]|nr:hypothetical protein [Nostocales cyanobacterium LEGE 12452]